MEGSTEYPLKADQRKRFKLALDIHNECRSINNNQRNSLNSEIEFTVKVIL
jgi:hypothetical protein